MCRHGAQLAAKLASVYLYMCLTRWGPGCANTWQHAGAPYNDLTALGVVGIAVTYRVAHTAVKRQKRRYHMHKVNVATVAATASLNR